MPTKAAWHKIRGEKDWLRKRLMFSEVTNEKTDI